MDINTWTRETLTERCRADPEWMADYFLQMQNKLETLTMKFTHQFDEINLVKKLIIAIHDAKWITHDLDRKYFCDDASGVLHNLSSHRNNASHYDDRDRNKRSQKIRQEASMKYLLDVLSSSQITPSVRDRLWNLCTVDNAKYTVIEGQHPHPVDALLYVMTTHFSEVIITDEERALLDKKWQLLSFDIPFI